MWKPTLLLLLTVFIPSVSPTSDEDDVTEYEKDFHEFDQDADGVIDAQEIRSLYTGDLRPQELDAFIREVDVNQDGLITYPEYIDYAMVNF
ncbi:Polcalcin Nic t, putative [Perkinsus marinus ATCC 50983]|uniref:Polcalcin Nic t, putative n=1 Tax=Perkinsus marinus (strain ATCC 50983 / TXsc) TaxID=423536 RepID=C5K7I1_PERM5|nr:Polcalcin Nic t, putative [Perkinsus marinus ATCC 50983]EER19516.1 Polcalcin Nic t, putative [Perkinsus marinus ATCC 50983]|eukprot:XP_002787720.1 Polcalcin Nic t, putative [Perkinsus marinus ATCC 50983]